MRLCDAARREKVRLAARKYLWSELLSRRGSRKYIESTDNRILKVRARIGSTFSLTRAADVKARET